MVRHRLCLLWVSLLFTAACGAPESGGLPLEPADAADAGPLADAMVAAPDDTPDMAAPDMAAVDASDAPDDTPDMGEEPEAPSDFAYTDDPPLGPDGRPEGWSAPTHAKGADPQWDALFALDRVHRLDIAMPAATYQSMLDDLEQLLGGAGQGGQPGGGRPQRPPPEALAACADRAEGEPCDYVDDGEPVEGVCRILPNGPVCIAAGPAPGGNGLPDGDPLWVPVTVTHDGRPWHHVGMRFKGNSSLSSTWRNGGRKIGFRLTFDKYEDAHPATDDQRFYGFKKMTFAAGFGDPSMVRDIAASELLRGMGIPAARAAFYDVWVDTGAGPAFWGLYVMIEDVSDQLVERYWDDDDGNLYKPDGPGADWTGFAESGFEKKSNEEAADWSDVVAAIDALHADRGDAAAWRAGFEAVFDVRGFVRWLAVNTAMVNWDTYGGFAHNYYLYGDPDLGGRLSWIPWDHNEALGPVKQGTDSLTFEGVSAARWPLIRSVIDDPVYRQLYLDTLAEFTEALFDEAWLFPWLRSLHALAGPSLEAEVAPFTQLPNIAAYRSALEGGPEAVLPHIRERRARVLELLDAGWPE